MAQRIFRIPLKQFAFSSLLFAYAESFLILCAPVMYIRSVRPTGVSLRANILSSSLPAKKFKYYDIQNNNFARFVWV
jgi:hypothetical protein